MFIEDHRQEYSIRVMCRVLDVSESGYYAWRERPLSEHEREDARLAALIQQLFVEHRQVYGSPRLHAALAAQGIHVGRKRVVRLMQSLGLSALPKKRRSPQRTKSDPAARFAPNVLGRDFHAEAPNSKWVTDCTMIPTTQGWLYPAVVLDLSSRRVIGWAMGEQENEELVTLALRMALARRNPQSACFPLLHHSDRGSEYASSGYQECLKQEGIEVSMSRTGDCYDNAAMESFFATLKKECIHRHHFQNRSQARQTIFECLECFYNPVRLHSTLGYTSPRDFEEAADQKLS
jgi:putative transposase